MPKEAFFFKHDYNARNDRRLVRLAIAQGMAGIGAFWCLVEMLYEEEGYIMLSECDCIADELRTDKALINFLVKESGLFENDGKEFWSNSVIRRLAERRQVIESARESANKRWHAKALPAQCEGNAKEERINKENKEDSKEKEEILFNKNNGKHDLSYHDTEKLKGFLKDESLPALNRKVIEDELKKREVGAN